MNRVTVPIETSAGVFTAAFTEHGLSALEFPSNRRGPKSSAPPSPALARFVRLTRAALEATLAGRAPRELPPLDWRGATAFRQRVWEILISTPPGKTLTYAQVAAKLGTPKAARAVGGACGANPIPVLVPCHRVLATGGGLGGFSGGLDWKKKLLAAEAGAGRKSQPGL
jgi:O-6-methylguanine DNA methyltransferase